MNVRDLEQRANRPHCTEQLIACESAVLHSLLKVFTRLELWKLAIPRVRGIQALVCQLSAVAAPEKVGQLRRKYLRETVDDGSYIARNSASFMALLPLGELEFRRP